MESKGVSTTTFICSNVPDLLTLFRSSNFQNNMTEKQDPNQSHGLRRRIMRPGRLTDLQDVIDGFFASRQNVLVDRSMLCQDGDHAVQDEFKVFRSVLSTPFIH